MPKYAELFAPATRNDPGTESSSQGSSDSESTKFKLVFVDDEPNTLSGLCRVFRRENYEIRTASCAEEALQLMEADPAHLMISDHHMPQMHGCDLLKRIKERWPDTIRIMLTGNADVDAIMGAVNDGAVYKFLIKPCNDDDLRLTVSLALEQYTLRQENKQLKQVTKKQQAKIKKYSAVVDRSSGVLGNILVCANAITSNQLEQAVAQQKPDELLGDSLVRLGYVTESQIVRELQRSQNLVAVDLKEMQVSPHVAKFFPRELCETNRLIPIRLDDKTLTLAMADPSDIMKIDNISMWTGFTVVPVVAKSSDIAFQVREIYGEDDGTQMLWEVGEGFDAEPIDEIDIVLEDDIDQANVEELISTSGVPPIVRIVNAIIGEAIRSGASDIHLEPKTKFSVVRYRTDGMLCSKIRIPSGFHPPTVSRVKILAKMDVAERRRPQDGRITVKAGTKIVDVRVSTMPTINGEKVVMRILDKGASVKRAADLGMLDDDLERLQSLVARPQGIVIATGPTGSGKTTTLYSILNEMLHPTKNCETIEDPVEYFLEDANQVHVRENIGLSFSTVLKATLRQDPDVILVGEIRDWDTADAAFKAALTGHTVLTSLHTNNTAASITRLMDIGIKPYLIASALEGIIAQRLVRAVCRHCKTKAPPDSRILELLELRDYDMEEMTVGEGCERCNNTGYKGRIGLFEVFLVTDEFREIITSRFRESEIMSLARTEGMRTLREDGLVKAGLGLTTLEELLRVLGPPAELTRPCTRCGKTLDVQFSYCPHCGCYGLMICRECKTPLEKDWKLCPTCATPQEFDDAAPRAR